MVNQKKIDTNDDIRQELLAWLNSLLQLNITKVEQCGTGYVAHHPSLYPAIDTSAMPYHNVSSYGARDARNVAVAWAGRVMYGYWMER